MSNGGILVRGSTTGPGGIVYHTLSQLSDLIQAGGVGARPAAAGLAIP